MAGWAPGAQVAWRDAVPRGLVTHALRRVHACAERPARRRRVSSDAGRSHDPGSHAVLAAPTPSKLP